MVAGLSIMPLRLAGSNGHEKRPIANKLTLKKRAPIVKKRKLVYADLTGAPCLASIRFCPRPLTNPGFQLLLRRLSSVTLEYTCKGYKDAPSDGSAWTTGHNCGNQVPRGGSRLGSLGVSAPPSAKGGFGPFVAISLIAMLR